MDQLPNQDSKDNFQIPSLDNLSLNTGQFHIPSLTFPSSSSSGNDGGSTLSSLASEHLTHNPSSLQFAPLSDSGTGGASSLLEIANLHLSSQEGEKSSFQIPSLFGSGTVSLQAHHPEQTTKEKEDNQGADIDLSLALNTATKPQKITQNKKQDTFQNTPTLPKKSIESEILVTKEYWNKENLSLQQKSCSTLGKVVCRRWRAKPRFSTKKPHSEFKAQIVPFSFDTASPDDIVRVAQGQAFTRPKINQ